MGWRREPGLCAGKDSRMNKAVTELAATGRCLSNFIDGRFVASGKATFENRNPATGELINLVSEADASAVDDAVKAARRALKGPWGRMSEQERSAVLRKVADGIMRRFDEFLKAEVLDTGKPASLASHIDIPRGAANFNIFADQVIAPPAQTVHTVKRVVVAPPAHISIEVINGSKHSEEKFSSPEAKQ